MNISTSREKIVTILKEKASTYTLCIKIVQHKFPFTLLLNACISSKKDHVWAINPSFLDIKRPILFNIEDKLSLIVKI